MKPIDISPVLSSQTPVFPGDTVFQAEVIRKISASSTYELSKITLTPHSGAHADAPSHYHPKGQSIENLELLPYLGICQVIRVQVPGGERIYPIHLKGTPISAPRVLFATGSFDYNKSWHSSFNSLSPELIALLSTNKCKLVGIDTPSIDPAESKALESHQAVYESDIRVLEGLNLTDVSPGLYQLIALPLKISGVEASPVRAVLLPANADLSRM